MLHLFQLIANVNNGVFCRSNFCYMFWPAEAIHRENFGNIFYTKCRRRCS